MNTERESCTSLGHFHMARGLGMVLILLGHSITPFFRPDGTETVRSLFSGAGSVLGGGMMAMFFMISGIGFFCRRPGKCIATQTKLLLKPYYITAAAVLLTKALLALVKQRPFADHGAEYILTYLLGLNAEGGGTLLGFPIESVSIFWFILALYTAWLLFNSILRIKSRTAQMLLVTLCVTASWLLTLVSDVWPFCLPIGLLSVGYLAFGYAIRQHQLLDRKLPFWCWAVIWSITLICAAFGGVSIVSCRWQLGLLDVAGSFCVGFLLMRLYHWFMSANRRGALLRLLEGVGLHSIWIVFLHGYEKVIFPWHKLLLLFPDRPVLCVCLCFLLRSAVIYGLYRLISALLRRLRGKRRPGKITIEL